MSNETIYYVIHKGTGHAVAKVKATCMRDAEVQLQQIADVLDYAVYDLMVEQGVRDEL
jgi:hypothetical protein